VGVHPTRCDELNLFSAATALSTSSASSDSSAADYTEKHLQALKAVIDEGAAAGKVRNMKERSLQKRSSKNFLRTF
jgi:hypothetical protein